jgi:hypothetical protein
MTVEEVEESCESTKWKVKMRRRGGGPAFMLVCGAHKIH